MFTEIEVEYVYTRTFRQVTTCYLKKSASISETCWFRCWYILYRPGLGHPGPRAANSRCQNFGNGAYILSSSPSV